MKTRVSLLVGMIVATSTLFASPTSARDQGSAGAMSPKKQHIEFVGTPLAGVYAGDAKPVQAYGEFRPPVCRTVTHCDAVEFEVDYPKDYIRDVFFGITVTLTWDNPYDAKKNPTGNDLDLFLWGDEEPSGPGPASRCAAPDDAPCENIMPEVIGITEPPNTTAEDAEPRAIFLTIVNHHGVNTGYTLNIDWYIFDLPPPPAFEPPERTTSFRESVQGPFDFKVTESREGVATPKPTPRKILVPGPDGKLHEVELPIYAAGQRLGGTAERSNTTSWIVAGVVAALAVGALIFYLVRLDRRAMEM